MALLTLDTGQQLNYEQYAGETNRPWLVFLHEGLGSITQWRDYPQQLCQRTGCPGMVYDRIGYGLSSQLTRPRTIHYLHEYALYELPLVLDAVLPDQNFILIGHSDGGSISLLFSAERWPRLLGTVTVSAHVFVEPASITGVEQAELSFARGELKRGLTRHHGDKTETMFRAWADTWTSPWFRSWNIEYVLPAIEVPMLVLQGRDDQYGTSAQVDAIVNMSAGPATPLLLEDCSHSPHLEFPELSLDLMSCFVNRLAR